MDSDEQEFIGQLKEEFVEKVEEDKEIFVRFLRAYQSSGDPEELVKLMRALHSLKGSATAVGFVKVGSFLHEVESKIQSHMSAKDAPDPFTTTLIEGLDEIFEVVKSEA